MKQIIARANVPDPLISVDEAKEQSRIDGDADDDTLKALVAAVSDAIDGPKSMLGRAVMPQLWGCAQPLPRRYDVVKIPITPLIEIEAVKFIDTDDVSHSMSIDEFRVYRFDTYTEIEPVNRWPSGSLRKDALTITASYGHAEEQVPEKIKQAARLLCAHWFENREATTDRPQRSIPFGVQCLLDIDRRGWVGA